MATKIKSIHFTKDETIIGFVESYQPKDSNAIANEKTPGKHMDLPRHADFERAMQALKPHLLLVPQLLKAKDDNGNHLQASHFKDNFAEGDEQYAGIEVTGILIQGKNAADGVQVFGTKTNEAGDVMKLKIAPTPLKRVEGGYNYEYIDVLDSQIDRLLGEGDLYHQRKKHGAGVQQDLPLNTPHVNTLKKVQGDLVEA